MVSHKKILNKSFSELRNPILISEKLCIPSLSKLLYKNKFWWFSPSKSWINLENVEQKFETNHISETILHDFIKWSRILRDWPIKTHQTCLFSKTWEIVGMHSFREIKIVRRSFENDPFEVLVGNHEKVPKFLYKKCAKTRKIDHARSTG